MTTKSHDSVDKQDPQTEPDLTASSTSCGEKCNKTSEPPNFGVHPAPQRSTRAPRQRVTTFLHRQYQTNISAGDTTPGGHSQHERMPSGGPPVVAWRFRRAAAVWRCHIFRPEGWSGPLAGARRGPWGSAAGQSRRGPSLPCRAPSQICFNLFFRKITCRKIIFPMVLSLKKVKNAKNETGS